MLHFTDGYGNSGRISDKLDVSYYGHWTAEVEAFVERLADGAVDDAGSGESDLETRLPIELPEEVPIVEIARGGHRQLTAASREARGRGTADRRV